MIEILESAEASGAIRPDLPPRARRVALVIWCSFLVAACATMVCFALLDPEKLPRSAAPTWWTGRRAVYAMGFFFFWLMAAASAALTLYMARTAPDGAERGP